MNHDPQVYEKFKQINRRQWIIAIPVFVLVIARIIWREEIKQKLAEWDLWISIVIFLCVLGALVFSYKNWRCPVCDSYLGRDLNPHYCKSCGVKLKDN